MLPMLMNIALTISIRVGAVLFLVLWLWHPLELVFTRALHCPAHFIYARWLWLFCKKCNKCKYCKTSANNKFAWPCWCQGLLGNVWAMNWKKYHLLCNFIKLQMAIQTNGNSDDLLRTSVPAMDIGSNQCQTSAMTKCKWKLQFHWEKTARTELRNQKSYCVTRFVSESEWSQKQWQKPISTFEMRAGILFFQSHVSRQEREFLSFSLMLRYENKNCSCWESRLRQFLQECFPIGTDKKCQD